MQQLSCCFLFLSAICAQELCTDEDHDAFSMLQALRREPGFGMAMAASVEGLQQLSQTIQNAPWEPHALLPPSDYGLLSERSTSARSKGSLSSTVAQLELALAMERRQKQQALAENKQLRAKDAALMQVLTARTNSNATALNRSTQQATSNGTFQQAHNPLKEYWNSLGHIIPFFNTLPLELKVAVAMLIGAVAVALFLSAIQWTLGGICFRFAGFFSRRAKGAARLSTETKKTLLGTSLVFGTILALFWHLGFVQPILSSLLVYIVLIAFAFTLLVLLLREMWNASKNGILFPLNAIMRMHKQFTEIERQLGIISSDDANKLHKGKHPEIKGQRDDDDDDSGSDDSDDGDGDAAPADPQAEAKKAKAAQRQALAARLGGGRT